MRSKLLLGIALLALIGPLSANAIPLSYSVTYTPTVGASGTGSFVYDDATSIFSNFNFTFGAVSGALPVINWTDPVFGGTRGQFFFEILSGQDVHPVGCGITTCTFNVGGLVSSALTAVEFRRSAGVTQYLFRNDVTTLLTGTLAIAQVPEPVSLGLLGIGLLGIAAARKRRAA